jgi:hypothetical protein
MLLESLEDKLRTDSASLVVKMLDLIEGSKRKITPALAQGYRTGAAAGKPGRQV